VKAKLGKVSLERLATCHPDLIRYVMAFERCSPRDFTVLCGHRGEAEQRAAYRANPPTSKLDWPNSKHNQTPSLAVDLAPYPVDWTAAGKAAFADQRDELLELAGRMGIRIRVISWDWPHFELV
jgi:peptidoglycan LD-endopeptidase CwlK